MKGELNSIIQEMIVNKKPKDEILDFVKDNRDQNLTPKTLGMLFEIIVGLEEGVTNFEGKSCSIDELKNIHPSFKSTNGNQWARSDGSYLGKKYIIERIKASGRVSEVKIVGLNSEYKNRTVSQKIKEELSGEKCAILDIGVNLEIDHKNGRYDNLVETKEQKSEDFQVLSKAVNDAKRQHCKKCKETHLRFDAKRLGYTVSFTKGDECSDFCEGCYWHDPKRFNFLISSNYSVDS